MLDQQDAGAATIGDSASGADTEAADQEIFSQGSFLDGEAADAKRHRICGVLAHELRNPLSVFKTAVDLLEDASHVDPQLHAILKLQTERMTHLVDDLLDMSRYANGKTLLKKQPTPLQRIIDAAIESTQATLAAKQQSVVSDIRTDGVWVDCDPFRLTQVFVNLFSNASKFSENGLPIRLSLQRDGDHVEMRVTDDGIGIRPDHLSLVFDFFTQSQTADSLNHSGGLGIGLGLVKGHVEMHEGTVIAHSDGKDCGSTFVVRLPVCAPVEAPQISDLSANRSERYRVLIVDDRRENEYLLNALVKKFGARETRSAHDGPAAMEYLKDFQPDLILLDLGLPGMSGLTLAREIRKLPQTRDTFIVALTGYDDPEMREQAEAVGIDLYRLKPASIEMIQEVFARVDKKCGSRF